MGNRTGSKKKLKPTRAELNADIKPDSTSEAVTVTPSTAAKRSSTTAPGPTKRRRKQVSSIDAIATTNECPSPLATDTGAVVPPTLPLQLASAPIGTTNLTQLHRAIHRVKQVPKLDATTILPWVHLSRHTPKVLATVDVILKTLRNSFAAPSTKKKMPISSVRPMRRATAVSQSQEESQSDTVAATFLSISSFSLRRLLIEDVLLLPIGQPLLLLIAEAHPFFTSYESIYSSSDSDEKRRSVSFNDQTYLQLQAVVVSNNRKEDFDNGLISRTQLNYLLSHVGGGSIGVSVLHSNQAAFEIKWNEILSCPDTLQVWSESPMTRSFKNAFKNYSNKETREILFTNLSQS